jgi:D-alanine--poly(phosphoribitol) ligase subunit 2
MDAEKIVLDAVEEVLGLDGLEDSKDLNLLDEGLVDSLSAVYLMVRIEEMLGIKIDISQMTPKDFSTVNSIIAAVERGSSSR